MPCGPPGTGCLCWSSRTCLILWTAFGVFVFTFHLAWTQWDFSNRGYVFYFAVSYVQLCIQLFGLLAAILKSRRLLQCFFIFLIAHILLFITVWLFVVIAVQAAIRSMEISEEDGKYLLLKNFLNFSLEIVVTSLQAWTTIRCIREIDLGLHSLPTFRVNFSNK